METFNMQKSHFYQHETYKENKTIVMVIQLLGFQNLHSFKSPLFSLFLLIYCVTILENILIIVLVSTCKNLQFPMYFFLQHLSISDVLLITNIVPNMLHIIVNDGATLSLAGCMTQYIIFGSSEVFDSFLLTVMSYDRYLAICNPLLYSSIMNHQLCITLVAISWIVGFTVIITFEIHLSMLKFCGLIIIDHFFCESTPLMELTCSDTFLLQIEVFILVVTLIILPFLFIIGSYVCIAFAIQKIKSNTGRQKAFSTCSSHLAVVGLFYGTLFGMYAVPKKSNSPTTKKCLSLLYTVVTPFLNPIVYSLRSKDMKEALRKCVRNENFITTNTTHQKDGN